MISIEQLRNKRRAVLVLNNGTIFHGTGFGATGTITGELVFTTFTGAGYYEALTDPSNHGQIYCLTYPIIGNYGIPAWEKDSHGIWRYFESNHIHCSGFVVNEACTTPSHYTSTKNIDTFLSEANVPGIEGIDTRALTKILRTEGVQIGMIKVLNPGESYPDSANLITEVNQAKNPNLRHLVQEVSCFTPQIYTPVKSVGVIVAVDCGIKLNIIRNLLKRRLTTIVVPYNISYQDLMQYHPDGVVLSNGPGDPKMCTEVITLAQHLIADEIPTMGICLGNQILALAAGANTYKLKYGHRGGNKTVIDLRTGKAFITSQNHGYAVDPDSLQGTGFIPLFENVDDHSNEGISHPQKPIFAVQFHPEGHPGPEDTSFLFDDFLKLIAFRAYTTVNGRRWQPDDQIMTNNSNGTSTLSRGEFSCR